VVEVADAVLVNVNTPQDLAAISDIVFDRA
jgi:CTP:molybdopterin cytidylyltransferase MocA